MDKSVAPSGKYNKREMKIKQKLLSGFLSIALLVAVVGYASGRASEKVLYKNIGQSSAALAAQILEFVDEEIERKAEVFQEYSCDPMVQQFAAESNREFEKMADRDAYIKETDRQWVAALDSYITPFMQNLIGNELSEKFRKKVAFYNKKYGSNAVGEIFITNSYGVNAAQSRKTSDYLQADEKWWQNAKQNGLAVTDADYDLSSGLYSISICTRIDDDAGNFLGVMKTVVNINEIIEHIRAAKERYAIFKLLTEDGRIIYSTEEDFNFSEHGTDNLLSYFQGKKGYKPYVVITDEKQNGEEKLIACARSKESKDYKGLDWILTVEYNTKDIFAPVVRLQASILIITAIITAFAIIFGLFISSNISHSIGSLAAAAEKISQGHLDVQVEIESEDEIGQLAAAFNKMAEDLRKTTTSKDYLDSVIAEHKRAEAKLQESIEQLGKRNMLHAKQRKQIAELEQRINKLLAELGRQPEYQVFDITQNQN
jgi:HAMP domain-containing protein